MREILFRGKANGGCCWVYGHYAMLNDGYRPDCKRHYILSGELRYNDQYGKEDIRKVEIDPNTLGQYTGLKDKNGKMIFDGDICKTDLKWASLLQIVFNDYCAAFQVLFDDGYSEDFHQLYSDVRHIEVIGNIHDNPELLKEKP